MNKDDIVKWLKCQYIKHHDANVYSCQQFDTRLFTLAEFEYFLLDEISWDKDVLIKDIDRKIFKEALQEVLSNG